MPARSERSSMSANATACGSLSRSYSASKGDSALKWSVSSGLINIMTKTAMDNSPSPMSVWRAEERQSIFAAIKLERMVCAWWVSFCVPTTAANINRLFTLPPESSRPSKRLIKPAWLSSPTPLQQSLRSWRVTIHVLSDTLRSGQLQACFVLLEFTAKQKTSFAATLHGGQTSVLLSCLQRWDDTSNLLSGIKGNCLFGTMFTLQNCLRPRTSV